MREITKKQNQKKCPYNLSKKQTSKQKTLSQQRSSIVSNFPWCISSFLSRRPQCSHTSGESLLQTVCRSVGALSGCSAAPLIRCSLPASFLAGSGSAWRRAPGEVASLSLSLSLLLCVRLPLRSAVLCSPAPSSHSPALSHSAAAPLHRSPLFTPHCFLPIGNAR